LLQGVSSFTAISAAAPEEPSGGGGGAGISPPTEPEEEEVPEEAVARYGLDINVDVLDKYKEIKKGEKIVVAEVKIYSTGTQDLLEDIELEYYIQDGKGEFLAIAEEKVDVDESVILLKELEAYEGLSLGQYWFVGKVKYENVGATDDDSFEVVERKIAAPIGKIIEGKNYPFLAILIIILILILLAITREYIRRQKVKKMYGYHPKQDKQDLNKLMRYIKKSD